MFNEPLDHEIRISTFFKYYLVFAILSHFLFFLEAINKPTGFYIKFWVELAKLLASRFFRSLLLHGKPAQRSWQHISEDFKTKSVL